MERNTAISPELPQLAEWQIGFNENAGEAPTGWAELAIKNSTAVEAMLSPRDLFVDAGKNSSERQASEE